MNPIHEGNLTFTFPNNWKTEKYDDWQFYKNRFKDSCVGNKAVDILALEPGGNILWMIEIKDYRNFSRSKEITLWDEMAIKTRDTLAGLFAAKIDTAHPNNTEARAFVSANKLRVILHLEQRSTNTKLFKRAYNLATVQQKLKQIVKPIDAHPRVFEMSLSGTFAWNVT